MNKLVFPALLVVLVVPCRATTTVSNTYSVGTLVPDNSGVGFSNTRQITTSITSITNVTVQISMSGGWSGDMYAYLTHGGGFSVLLNRPGRSLADLAGSGVDQFSAEFGDYAPFDIHTGIPSSGTVSGFFQPDAREIDPASSLDTSPRSAFLASFNGLDANGDWTLFMADVLTGDQMMLNSWSLTVQGVPEPATAAMVALGMLGLLRRQRGSDGRRNLAG